MANYNALVDDDEFQKRLAIAQATNHLMQQRPEFPTDPITSFENSARSGFQQPFDAENYLVKMGYKNPSSVTRADAFKMLLDLVPGIGDVIAIDEGATEWGKGNKGMAALNFASAVPAIGDAAKLMGAGGIGLVGLLAQMGRQTGKAPITPFSRQAGVIGGQSARTANLDLLAKAQDMAEQGAKREDIWSQTGWFKGADEKWRFEIDDSEAVFKLGYKGTPIGEHFDDAYQGRRRLPFHEVMDHTGVSEAYAEKLNSMGAGKQLPGFIAIPDKTGYGSYNAGDDLIELNRSLTKLDARSTALHELQHAIQRREGFATGGNPAEFIGQIRNSRNEALEKIQSLNLRMTETVRLMDKLEAERYSNPNAASMIDNLKREYQSLMAKKMELVPLSNFEPSEKAIDKYMALAGEAEARAVQARRNMTPAERASRPFWLDYDVPEADQIVRFR